MPKDNPENQVLNDIIQSSETNKIIHNMYYNVSDLILFLDPLGRIIHINQAGINFSGFTEKEILGKLFLTIPGVFNKEYIKEYLTVFKKTFQGKPTKKFIGKLNEKNGKPHIMEFSTFPIRSKRKITYIMVIGHDITEEKRIMGSLKHSTNVIDSSSEFILSVNTNFTILTWNMTAEKITGYTRQEILGKNLMDITIFEDTKNLMTWCKQNITGGKNQPFNSLVLTKDNKRKILKLYCSPINKGKNEEKDIIFFGNEVTSNNEKQEQLIPGTSYLVLNKDPNIIFNQFCTLVSNNAQGLVITRGNIDLYRALIRQLNIEITTLGKIDDNKIKSILTIKELKQKVITFITSHPQPIILIDRIDFLIIQFTYELVLQALYHINSMISASNAILLLRLNSEVLTPKQLAILKEEFFLPPGQQVESIELSDKLFRILQYINTKNQQHLDISFSKIQDSIGISKATTQKRLRILEGYGLIEIQKKGKTKTVHVLDKGKNIISKRKNI